MAEIAVPLLGQLAPKYHMTDPLDRGLVGEWRFDKNTGLMLPDYSGYGNHGTIQNSAGWTTTQSGIMLDMPNVAGGSEHVLLGATYNYTDNFSVETFAIANAFSSWTGIFTNLNDGTNIGWGLVIGDAILSFICNGGGGGSDAFADVDANPPVGTPFHLVGVRRNGTSYVYLNGVLQADTGDEAPATTSTDTVIGRWRHENDGGYCNAAVGLCRIYDRVLTSNEVAARYQIVKARASGVAHNWLITFEEVAEGLSIPVAMHHLRQQGIS